MYVWYAGGPEHVEDGHLEERGDTGDYEVPGAALPQLRFIHIHQLFRILYTLLVDTVNIYWWWCINSCRAALATRTAIFRFGVMLFYGSCS